MTICIAYNSFYTTLHCTLYIQFSFQLPFWNLLSTIEIFFFILPNTCNLQSFHSNRVDDGSWFTQTTTFTANDSSSLRKDMWTKQVLHVKQYTGNRTKELCEKQDKANQKTKKNEHKWQRSPASFCLFFFWSVNSKRKQ